MNSNTMVHWLRAMVQAMPHGGKQKAAGMLGITASALSKLVNNPERGFDEKTLNAVAWVETSKSARWPMDKYPILDQIVIGPIIVETRKGAGPAAEPFWTWKPVTPAAEPKK